MNIIFKDELVVNDIVIVYDPIVDGLLRVKILTAGDEIITFKTLDFITKKDDFKNKYEELMYEDGAMFLSTDILFREDTFDMKEFKKKKKLIINAYRI